MRYMLDTNICIYAIKHKPAQVLVRLLAKDPSQVCISSITYSELMHGVEKSEDIDRNRAALLMMFANMDILPFDTNAAQEYGKIRADLEKQGRPIGPMDTLIAAHAKAQECILVSNNLKEFCRVEGLLTENWVE